MLKGIQINNMKNANISTQNKLAKQAYFANSQEMEIQEVLFASQEIKEGKGVSILP